MIEEFQYSIGLNIKNFNTWSFKKQDSLQMIVGSMNSSLYNTIFDFNLPEDIMRLNKIYLCHQICCASPQIGKFLDQA